MNKHQRRHVVPLVVVHLLVLAACQGGSPLVGSTAPSTTVDAATAIRAAVAVRPPSPGPSLSAQVGKLLFFDPSLSASRRMSCATCHDPARAYGPPNALAVQLGGPDLTSPGMRAVPSLRYKEYTRGYADLLDNPDGFSEPAPGGGFAWDGRADSLAEQAKMPLLSPFEMANASAADVIDRVRASTIAPLFIQAFGANVFANVDVALADVASALQAFQLEDASFHPYSSKFDLHVAKKPEGAFTAAEERGFKVFNDPKIGNCAACHLPDASLDDGGLGQLTDYTFSAIGVPRNPLIPANRNRHHNDMGICGPLRTDHLRAGEFCGMFKTPSLRNVATREAFFHNGVIHTLEQAVRFYNTRDTMPQLWYPTVGGRPKAKPDPSFPGYGLITTQYVGGVVQKFDDLPTAFRANIDRQLPLDGRAVGSRNPMSEQEVSDLVCFLKTLSDGYRPGREPATCVD